MKVVAYYLILVTMLALGLVVPNKSSAQDVRAYVYPDSITVGDQFRLVVVAAHSPGDSVDFPAFSPTDIKEGASFGDLRVLGSTSPGKILVGVGGDYPVADTIAYLVTTFAIDTARVDPVRVRIRKANGPVVATSDPFFVRVESVLTGNEDDVRDITPLATFPMYLVPLIVGLLVALVAAAVLRYFYLRSRNRPEEEIAEVLPEPPMPTYISPIKEATERLNALEDHPTSTHEEKKLYFVELADIIRTYFARRLEVPALETTSSELIALLSNSRTNEIPGLIDDLREILTLSDLAKFAKHEPTRDQSLAILGETRVFLMRVEHGLTDSQNQGGGNVDSDPIENIPDDETVSDNV